MFLFGYEAKGEATRDIAYYVIDAGGHVTHEAWFEAPYASYIHDFRVSRSHTVIPISPVTVDLDRLKAGGEHWQWDSSKPSYVGVLPRYGRGDQIEWIEVPAHAPGHFLNSYDEDGSTVVDVCQSAKGPFPFFFPDVQGNMFDPQDLDSRLTRWHIDPNGSQTSVRVERLDETPLEFPQIDARMEMSRHRHGYFVIFDAGVPTGGPVETPDAPAAGPARGVADLATLPQQPDLTFTFRSPTGIGHYDFDKREFAVYRLPAGDTAQEVEFVPASPDAPEGVGYLLALVNRVNERHSDLLVFDAQDVAAGPLGGYKLPVRLSTIHGTWVPEHQLALSTRTASHPAATR